MDFTQHSNRSSMLKEIVTDVNMLIKQMYNLRSVAN